MHLFLVFSKFIGYFSLVTGYSCIASSRGDATRKHYIWGLV